MTERTCDDYKAFCRGQVVCVQLKQHVLMCERGSDGSIELAKLYEVHPAQWAHQLAAAFEEANGHAPTDGEIAEMMGAKPPPVRPLSAPIYVGVLEVRAPFLVGVYQDNAGHEVEFTIDPSDVKHISVLKEGLIAS